MFQVSISFVDFLQQAVFNSIIYFLNQLLSLRIRYSPYFPYFLAYTKCSMKQKYLLRDSTVARLLSDYIDACRSGYVIKQHLANLNAR